MIQGLRTGSRWGLALFAFTFSVYLLRPILTGRPGLETGDTVPTRLLPVSLLREGNLNLDEFFPPDADKPGPYFIVERSGHHYSALPIGAPVLLTPIYGILETVGVPVLDDPAVRDMAANGIAAFLSALAVVIFFQTYAPRGLGRALCCAGILAFATGVWPTCSQDLWQHTFGVLWMSLCVWSLERGLKDDRWLGHLGLPAGLLFFVRPANVLLLIVLALVVLLRRPYRLVTFAAWSLPFAIATIAYNLDTFGTLTGAYSDEAAAIQPLRWLPIGLPGLLVSPARGLLVYSPVLLLAAWGLGKNIAPESALLRRAFAAMIVAQLLLYGSYMLWYGGYCFGPRMLLEVMVPAVSLVWYAWPRVTACPWRKGIVASLSLWAVCANGIGYVFGFQQWNDTPNVDRCPSRLWDWRDNPLAAAVFGLPARCPYPLTAAGDHWQINGVAIAPGRGWTGEMDKGAFALGAESELFVRFQGQPTRCLVFSLRAEAALEEAQVVTVAVDSQPRGKLRLSPGDARDLLVPLSPTDVDKKEVRVTLNWASHGRRHWHDIRPYAAELLDIWIGIPDGPLAARKQP